MARTATVSDLDIFTAVKVLVDENGLNLDAGERPSRYAIRKYLMDAAPGYAAPSYGLIGGALERLDQLLAAGNRIEALIREDAPARTDASIDAIQRLTIYLSDTLRPVAKKLFDDAHASAVNRERDLEISLDDANRERESLQNRARTLSDQLRTHAQDLQQTREELATALAHLETEKAIITSQQNEIAHLKTIATRDRDALDREREHHRQALQKLQDELNQRDQKYAHDLRLEREANAVLNQTIATLSADRTALFDKHRAEIQQREALQTICNEQLTAINATEQWRQELMASLDELRKQNTEQAHALRELRRSDEEWRAKSGSLEDENKILDARVKAFVENEAQLKIQLRESDIISQSRIRELESINSVLKETLTARDELIKGKAKLDKSQ